MLYVWYLKKQVDWDTIHEVNDVIKTPEEVETGQADLFGHENGASKNL